MGIYKVEFTAEISSADTIEKDIRAKNAKEALKKAEEMSLEWPSHDVISAMDVIVMAVPELKLKEVI
jgi:hypothetical protein